MGYAFISYSSHEYETALTIKNLFNKSDIETWMAPNDIPTGSRYGAVINQAIRDSDCLVLLVSEASQNSEFVNRELERAVSFKKTIVPVLIEDVPLNDEFEFFLAGTHVTPLEQIDESSPAFEELLQRACALTVGTLATSGSPRGMLPSNSRAEIRDEREDQQVEETNLTAIADEDEDDEVNAGLASHRSHLFYNYILNMGIVLLLGIMPFFASFQWDDVMIDSGFELYLMSWPFLMIIVSSIIFLISWALSRRTGKLALSLGVFKVHCPSLFGAMILGNFLLTNLMIYMYFNYGYPDVPFMRYVFNYLPLNLLLIFYLYCIVEAYTFCWLIFRRLGHSR